MPSASESKFGPLGKAIDIGLDGGRLIHGSPPDLPRSTNDRIGRSLWWIPDSISIESPLYSVVSSRIGRNPHRRPAWFYMLERAIEIATRDDASMLIVDGTASAKWLDHACERFRLKPVRIKIAEWNEDVSDWMGRLKRDHYSDAIYVSPPMDQKKANRQRSASRCHIDLRRETCLRPARIKWRKRRATARSASPTFL